MTESGSKQFFPLIDQNNEILILELTTEQIKSFPALERLEIFATTANPLFQPSSTQIVLNGIHCHALFISQRVSLLSKQHIGFDFRVFHFTFNSLYVEKKVKAKSYLDGSSILEWIDLFIYLGSNKEFIEAKVLDYAKKSIKQTPKQFLVQQFVENFLASDLYKKISFETITNIIADIVNLILPSSKSKSNIESNDKFKEKIIVPLLETLANWQIQSQELSFPFIVLILFLFFRPFCAARSLSVPPPLVNLTVTEGNDGMLFIFYKESNIRIMVKKDLEIGSIVVKWVKQICLEDHRNQWVTSNISWFCETPIHTLQSNQQFRLPEKLFLNKDPIQDDFFDIFEGSRFKCWCTGGNASRTFRNKRHLDMDCISDIDIYIYYDKDTVQESEFDAIIGDISMYFLEKTGKSKVFYYRRRHMYTIFTSIDAPPLQISFQPNQDVTSTYSKFDFSHVQIAFQKRKWRASLHGWFSNIFEQKTYALKEKIEKSRAAKVFSSGLPVATTNTFPLDFTIPSDSHDTATNFISTWSDLLSPEVSRSQKRRKVKNNDGDDILQGRAIRYSGVTSGGELITDNETSVQAFTHGTLWYSWTFRKYEDPDDNDNINGYIITPSDCYEEITFENVYFVPFNRKEVESGYFFGPAIKKYLSSGIKVYQTKGQRQGFLCNSVYGFPIEIWEMGTTEEEKKATKPVRSWKFDGESVYLVDFTLDVTGSKSYTIDTVRRIKRMIFKQQLSSIKLV